MENPLNAGARLGAQTQDVGSPESDVDNWNLIKLQ